MKVVILAGGSGTRLWPISRENYPKQFIKINGESLLLKTYKRFLKICDKKDIYVITNEKYRFYVFNEISSLNDKIENNLILEPVGRNTSGAIILSLVFLKEKAKLKENEPVFVTPSDHIIINEEKFIDSIKISRDYCFKKKIITFGIKPENPHTGYGYIKAGKEIEENIFEVEKFTEKPNLEKAKEYFKSGKYFWNSGMFMFSYETMLKEFKKHKPSMYNYFKYDYEKLLKNFSELENISIDYSIMEKTDNALTVKSDIGWSDVGGWESFSDIVDKDDKNNVKIGNIMELNTKNSIVYSNSKRLITIIDMEDIMVIDSEDALLIAKKGSGEKVKEIVSKLKNKNKIEAVEHPTVYRPWGSYTVLEEGERYKIKRIFVKPNHKLSQQMHYHRSEHWVVIKGTAKVTINDRENIVHENESIYVPKSTKHRLENPGKVPLELIEVQNGEYVGEDDIVRFDDVYGRK